MHQAIQSVLVLDEHQIEVGEHEGAEAVLAGLRVHVGHAACAEFACGALQSLTRVSERHASLVGDGLVEALTVTMQSHSAIAAVQHGGCGTLRNLATSAACIPQILAQGGGAAVVSALRTHGCVHSDVAQHGCGAFANMTVVVEAVAALSALDAASVVRHVMTAHGKLGRQRDADRERARVAGLVASKEQQKDEAAADAALAAVRKCGKLALTGLAR